MLTSILRKGGTVLSEWGLTLTLDEVAAALRLSPGSYSEPYLKALITSACQTFEARTGWALNRACYEAIYDSWPQERVLALPKYPVSAITGVSFKRPGFGYHTWESLPKKDDRSSWGWEPIFATQSNEGFSVSAWHVDLHLPPLPELPELIKGQVSAVKVEFWTWMYGSVPASIKTVLYMIISDLYDGRSEPNAAVESLLMQHRLSGFAA